MEPRAGARIRSEMIAHTHTHINTQNGKNLGGEVGKGTGVVGKENG